LSEKQHAGNYPREEGLQCPTCAYQQGKEGLLDAIRRILADRRNQAKTLYKFGWDLTQVSRIRALDARFKAVLDDTYNVNFDNVFNGKAL